MRGFELAYMSLPRLLSASVFCKRKAS